MNTEYKDKEGTEDSIVPGLIGDSRSSKPPKNPFTKWLTVVLVALFVVSISVVAQQYTKQVKTTVVPPAVVAVPATCPAAITAAITAKNTAQAIYDAAKTAFDSNNAVLTTQIYAQVNKINVANNNLALAKTELDSTLRERTTASTNLALARRNKFYSKISAYEKARTAAYARYNTANTAYLAAKKIADNESQNMYKSAEAKAYIQASADLTKATNNLTAATSNLTNLKNSLQASAGTPLPACFTTDTTSVDSNTTTATSCPSAITTAINVKNAAQSMNDAAKTAFVSAKIARNTLPPGITANAYDQALTNYTTATNNLTAATNSLTNLKNSLKASAGTPLPACFTTDTTSVDSNTTTATSCPSAITTAFNDVVMPPISVGLNVTFSSPCPSASPIPPISSYPVSFWKKAQLLGINVLNTLVKTADAQLGVCFTGVSQKAITAFHFPSQPFSQNPETTSGRYVGYINANIKIAKQIIAESSNGSSTITDPWGNPKTLAGPSVGVASYPKLFGEYVTFYKNNGNGTYSKTTGKARVCNTNNYTNVSEFFSAEEPSCKSLPGVIWPNDKLGYVMILFRPSEDQMKIVSDYYNDPSKPAAYLALYKAWIANLDYTLKHEDKHKEIFTNHIPEIEACVNNFKLPDTISASSDTDAQAKLTVALAPVGKCLDNAGNENVAYDKQEQNGESAKLICELRKQYNLVP